MKMSVTVTGNSDPDRGFELAKMLQRYPSSRMKHTPPPVRRFYSMVAVCR
jgi:hypothetical protein